MKFYRKWIFLAVAILLFGALVGCQQSNNAVINNDNSKDNNEKPADEITISVAASAGWVRDIDRELAKKFEEETGIKVDIQANPNDQYENVLLTRLNTGEGPDIFMAECGLSLQKVQPDKYAVDLANESWVEQYPEFMMSEASYNDRLVGFTTWGRDFRAMIYNTKIFDEYDIKVPTSYDEFAEACEILMANDIIPVYFAGGEEWYCGQAFDGAINIETKAPGTYEKLNNKEMTFSESEEALKFLRNLQNSAEKGYFGENFLSNLYGTGAAEMASGKYAMWFGWSTFVNDIDGASEDVTADQFLAFPSPYSDEFETLSVTGAGITRLINKDGENIDACKLYFEFLAREENLQAYYDGRVDLLESTFEGIEVSAPKNFEAAMQQVDYRTLKSPNQSVVFFSADGSFGKNVQSMLFGMMTPEQVLQSLDDARALMFKNTGN